MWGTSGESSGESSGEPFPFGCIKVPLNLITRERSLNVKLNHGRIRSVNAGWG